MSRRVLVAYGSRRGGTAGIAEAIALTLRERGCDVDCLPAADVDSVVPYDAVVVGAALYMFRWVSEAQSFVRRHAADLRARPVWMFSSGPLDDTASTLELAPAAGVCRLMRRIGARGHVTFGGRLTADAKGFIASRMAKRSAGDWRDWDRIRRWATSIADAVEQAPRVAAVAPPRPGGLVAALCLLTALTAIGGGIALVASRDGSWLNAPLVMLAHTPFSTFLVPGLLLLLLVGGSNLVAATLAIRRSRRALPAVVIAGAVLLAWIVGEMALLRTIHPLQLAYLTVALVLLAAAGRGMHLRTS